MPNTATEPGVYLFEAIGLLVPAMEETQTLRSMRVDVGDDATGRALPVITE